MSDKKVLVNVLKPVTYKGKDYGVGQHSLPQALADNIVRKKLGSLDETPEEVTTNSANTAENATESVSVTETQVEKQVKESVSADIPAAFPQLHIFIKLGFNSVAKIKAKTKEELVAREGIRDASAEKALAYRKKK